jgi:hypothetical protein
MLKPSIRSLFPWNKFEIFAITTGISILNINVENLKLFCLETFHDAQEFIVNFWVIRITSFHCDNVLLCIFKFNFGIIFHFSANQNIF